MLIVFVVYWISTLLGDLNNLTSEDSDSGVYNHINDKFCILTEEFGDFQSNIQNFGL
jgi:hypothetical protein